MGRRKDQAQFNMRLDRPLLKRLQNAAKDQDRSVNSEMVHRLEQSFTRDSIQDRLDALINARDSLQGRFDALIGKLSPILDTLEARETDEGRRERTQKEERKRKATLGVEKLAVQAREFADSIEREVTRHGATSEQEPELPLRQGQAKGDKS